MGEGLARYVLAFGNAPGWMTAGGQPASWGHYAFGMGNLDRLRAQQKLELMDAVKMGGQVKKDDWEKWVAELKLHSGWG